MPIFGWTKDHQFNWNGKKIIDQEKGWIARKIKETQYIASKTINISTVHLIILLIFGCQLYGKTVNIITFASGKYIISIKVRTKGVNYRNVDPTENYKNDFHSISDRPMMTVVTVKTNLGVCGGVRVRSPLMTRPELWIVQ